MNDLSLLVAIKHYKKKYKLCGCCGGRTFKPRRYCSSRHHITKPVYVSRFCCVDCAPIHLMFGNWCCIKCAAVDDKEGRSL